MQRNRRHSSVPTLPDKDFLDTLHTDRAVSHFPAVQPTGKLTVFVLKKKQRYKTHLNSTSTDKPPKMLDIYANIVISKLVILSSNLPTCQQSLD